MRVAVLSDIHGFDLAFESVLEDLDRSGPFDHIVVAGDLCELGPAPERVIAILQERQLPAVMGNTDLAIVEGFRDGTDDPELRYAIERLSQAQIDYLAALPFSIRITPPGGKVETDDLLVFHATPYSLIDRLGPELDDVELIDVLGPATAGAVAFGHVHICYVRHTPATLFVDVSAVGNSKDGDLRSKYGVLSWSAEDRRWSAEIRSVEYPFDETAAEVRGNNLPNAEKVIKRLKRARYKREKRSVKGKP